jgi:hypothetical protein
MTQAKSTRVFFLALAALAVTVGTGCRRNQTTASRSAAAFDATGGKTASPEPGSEGAAHGGHAAPTSASPAAGAALEGMAAPNSGTSADPMAGMDHSRMGGSGGTASGSMAGMDHSRMRGAARPQTGSMAGMDHSHMGASRGTASGSMAEMDHSQMPMSSQPTPADHVAMGHGPAPTARAPEVTSATAQPGAPTATLTRDALDAPAPTAIEEASRAESMAGHAMSHGTYRQVDAGRPEVPITSPAAGRQQQSAPDDAPADPHAGHGMPATPTPRPSPSPRQDR